MALIRQIRNKFVLECLATTIIFYTGPKLRAKADCTLTKQHARLHYLLTSNSSAINISSHFCKSDQNDYQMLFGLQSHEKG